MKPSALVFTVVYGPVLSACIPVLTCFISDPPLCHVDMGLSAAAHDRPWGRGVRKRWFESMHPMCRGGTARPAVVRGFRTFDDNSPDTLWKDSGINDHSLALRHHRDAVLGKIPCPRPSTLKAVP